MSRSIDRPTISPNVPDQQQTELAGDGDTEQTTILEALDQVCEGHISEDGVLHHPKRALKDVVEIVQAAPISPEQGADFILHMGGVFSVLVDDDNGQQLQDSIRRKHLPKILGAKRYMRMSQEIGQHLQNHAELPEGFANELEGTDVEVPTGAYDEDVFSSSLPTLAALSPAVRYEVIGRLADLKLIARTKGGGYKFPEKSKDQKYLLSGALELADGWRRVKESMVDGANIKNLNDAEIAMMKHNKVRAISKVVIETDKPGFAIAPINSLRIGHQDSLDGLRLVREYIEHVKSLPEGEKPDVLLVTDLMQGAFKHTQSQKRSSLAEGFQDANVQFRIAHELLAEMKTTGIPIVVGMSENDHREAKDYAVDAVRELDSFLKDAEKNDFVHFSQMYKFTQNAMFQNFKKFALDYIIPLSQKYGRRMRTADEMKEATGGKIAQSELMYLYEHINLGHDLDPISGLDPDDIVELGTWSSDGSIIYVDDCDLLLHPNDGREDVVKYRHALGLTAESLSSNHMINPLKLMGSIAMGATNNDELPTALMTGQQQEAAMVTHSGVDIISNPGLTNPFDSIDTRALHRRTTGDSSLRALTSRRRAWTPGVYEYSRPAEGVVRYTIYDADVMERSESIPRMAILSFNDWQVGSPTAHLDMIVHAQALAQRYAGRMPVVIHGEGDFNHGGIYSNMYKEAQAIGLMDMDSQAEMTNGMIRDTWQAVPSTDKEGVVHVLWLPGNHDEQQRVSFPGNNRRNVDDAIEVWRRALENPNVAPEDSIVKTERVFQGDDGTPVPTWIGRPRYGDVNMAVAHYHINSKNYKGGGGGLAAYDPLKRLEGMGGFEDVQIVSGAHHHNRMHVKANGVWVDIGDANAAGQSEFELMLAMHHSNMSVKVREIGGGKPMTVTYYTEEALIKETVQHGPYSAEALSDAGYFDDEKADPLKYGMYSLDGSPKTAVQKRLWVKQREASQWANHMSEPLHMPLGQRNEATRRVFAAAERLMNGE